MRLWFAFLGPPAFWTAHLLAGYGIEEATCQGSGSSVVVPVVIGATVVFGAATAFAGWTGWQLARTVGDGPQDPRGTIGLLSWTGALWSGLYLMAIVLGGVQLVALEPCVGA